MKRIPRAVLFAVGLAILASVAGGGIVFARGNDSANAGLVADQQGFAQQNVDDYIAKLAGNLGIDAQKLKDAMKKTSLDLLDKAVADGKLTQAQADKMRAAIESGNGFFLGGRGPAGPGGPEGPGKGGAPGFRFDDNTAVATFLGISADQLKTELKAGASLAEVAQAHGKTRDALKQYLVAQESAAIDKAVADGKLPQAAADKLKANLATQIDRMLDAKPGARQPHTDQPGTPPKGGAPRGGQRQAPSLLPSGLQ